jgi:5'-nucleotidase
MRLTHPERKATLVPASRTGRRLALATSLTGLLAAPLAVVTAAAPAHAAPVEIQILATNDFHGRLLSNTSNGAQEAGAAQLAGAVKQLESDYPDTTIFTAAGDLIGASTFESFIQRDKPTLDVMNAAGLDVSAAGNHEFDGGYDDLVERVMTPYDAATNPEGGAEWQYIAANVRKKSDGSYALPDVTAETPDPEDVSDGGTWMTTVGGVNVGFVGAVTEELPSLVSPAGISELDVTSIVDEVNAGATDLLAQGADVVVMLVHEGATSTDIASLSDGSAFAQIVAGVSDDVSAIISGHTHLAYNFADPNADTAGRPVVSAGQYGTNLNRLVMSVDPDSGAVSVTSKDIVQANTVALTDAGAIATRDEVAALVADAVAVADVLGAEVLGEIAAPFNRAKLSSGSENRGGESTLGNLVAEVQRWATGPESSGEAQIAFMNPGGLRQDMVGNNAGGYPAELTYKQAAVVQPFANTLVTMSMTGAQVKTLLEQQWQRNADGTVPSRPFLRLGTSEGFRFTYDPARPEGDRITGMWLDDVRLRAGTSYTVTANSFLASGGDNFRAFNLATDKRDSGRIDLQAMVDYMAANSPVQADATQHAVGVSLDADSYAPGAEVTAELSSLAFSTAPDPKDTEVEVFLDGESVGTAAVDNTIGTVAADEYGTATATFTVPPGARLGRHTVAFVGDVTGTRAEVDLQVRTSSVVSATATPASVVQGTGTSSIAVTVSSTGDVPTGTVAAILDGEVIGGAQLVDGQADVPVGPFDTAGAKTITIEYYGDEANDPASTTTGLTVTPAPVVEKATPTLSATVAPDSLKVKKDGAVVSLSATKASGTPSGAVIALVDGKVVGAGELAAGKVDIAIGPFDTVGTKTVTLKYFGDDSTKAGTTTVQVTVTKARPKLGVGGPKRVARGEKAVFTVTVEGGGYTPDGRVTIKVAGKKVTKQLKNGVARLRVAMTRLGKNKVVVRYSGDDLTTSRKKVLRVRVVR